MGKIRKLDDHLVNQIAAGEVVIQPCSVIKEIVENSIDAGCTKIELDFTGSGADMIRLSDNGMGMEKEDLVLAIQPHATSKIQSPEDLYRVVSCGFRGEALSSIAEVSHLEIVSRSKEHSQAYRLYKREGAYEIEAASRDVGTTLTMKNLFFNVPVRRRFLKSERSETACNLDVLRKLALSRPWVGFTIRHDGKMCFDLPEDQELEDRLRDLALYDKAASFLPLDYSTENITIKGMLVAPPYCFGNSKKIHMYINKRPINDKSLVQAFVRAGSDHYPERKFPGAVLSIDMDPEEVDVNIHPTKSEVRFRSADQVFRQVYSCVRQALLRSNSHDDATAPQTVVYKSSGQAKTIPMNRNYGNFLEGDRPMQSPFAAGGQKEDGHRPRPAFSPSQDQVFTRTSAKEVTKPYLSSHNCFEAGIEVETSDYTEKKGENADHSQVRAFQLLNRFILLEHDNHITIMDQHAIHERILYNQLLEEEKSAEHACQMLLAPEQLPFPEGLVEISQECVSSFKEMGFIVDVDENTINVNAVPDFLSLNKSMEVLEGMLEDLCEGVLPEKEQIRHAILQSMACRASVKAGERLTQDEVDQMASAIVSMDAGESCPHGRATGWDITIEQANSMFNR